MTPETQIPLKPLKHSQINVMFVCLTLTWNMYFLFIFLYVDIFYMHIIHGLALRLPQYKHLAFGLL